MYPGDPGEPGSDCAGVVLAMGAPAPPPVVTDSSSNSNRQQTARHLAVGDRVFGLAHGCLGTVVAGPACMLAPMPPDLSMAEAATVPTVLMTVEAALCHIAGLSEGKRVLVHAAAGGVGLSALQVRVANMPRVRQRFTWV